MNFIVFGQSFCLFQKKLNDFFMAAVFDRTDEDSDTENDNEDTNQDGQNCWRNVPDIGDPTVGSLHGHLAGAKQNSKPQQNNFHDNSLSYSKSA